MPVDICDPGPLGNWPYFPRKADGSPAWSDSAATDGKGVPGLNGREVGLQPRGVRKMRHPRTGAIIAYDVTPTWNGAPISPPTLAP